MNEFEKYFSGYGPNHGFTFYEVDAMKEGWNAAIRACSSILEGYGTAVLGLDKYVTANTEFYDTLAEHLRIKLLTVD